METEKSPRCASCGRYPVLADRSAPMDRERAVSVLTSGFCRCRPVTS